MLKRFLLMVLVLVSVVGAVVGSGRADEGDGRNGGTIRLLTTVPVPGNTARNASGKMFVFDISWVDQDTQLYYLADRSNAVVDVVNAKTGTFVKQISGASAAQPTGFTGFTGNNNTSGPNGVVVANPWLFVTDAPSRVVSIDLRTSPPHVVDDVRTGGAAGLRTDELAYDPKDGILLVVNNADDPPFATLIHVNKSTGHLTLAARITFDAAHGVDATNGAEQPVWDRGTGKFYVSIPEVNCPGGHNTPPTPPCGGGFHQGAVVRIDPHSTGAVDTPLFLVDLCQPAGLTLGPHQDLLLGCSVIFNTAGQAWTGLTDPNPAAPTQVIMDAKTGAIDKVVKGVGGADEVWFNHGDGRYYTASRQNPGAVPIAGNTPADPVLGVIDAESQTLIQLIPTFNTPGTSPPPRGSAHSVAVNSHNNHVLVPLPANNVFPDCSTGCVAVFGAPNGDHDED